MLHYLGVDVSEATLDVDDSEGEFTRSFPNTPAGVRRLAAWVIKRHAPEGVQVVLEPTSTYHQRLIVALASAGVAYTLVNPASAAYYIRARMKRTKTDRSDARMLARIGESEQLSPTPPPIGWREGLKSLMRHRDCLRSDARAWRNRLGAAEKSPWVTREEIASLRGMVLKADREAAKIETKVKGLAKRESGLMSQVRLLTSVNGIAELTALVIAIELPPVEQCRSAKTWAAFAGVAPSIQQSGKSEYSFLSRTGSARIRKALYMPALVAIKHNPAIKVFAERLKANGKSNMVVIAAVMHKLLRICFGILSGGRPFDLSMHRTTAVAAATAVVEIPLLQRPVPVPLVSKPDASRKRARRTAAATLPMP